jgi:hypothetical protein
MARESTADLTWTVDPSYTAIHPGCLRLLARAPHSETAVALVLVDHGEAKAVALCVENGVLTLETLSSGSGTYTEQNARQVVEDWWAGRWQ